MKIKVVGKQPNSIHCFVCGLENKYGLQSAFYELENGDVLAKFNPAMEHQGYPGRLHGGVSGAILDETIARAVMKHDDNAVWGVTLDFSMKFRKPVPIDREVMVRARVTSENRRTFEGTAEIVLPDGSIAVEGKGRYLKMEMGRITDADFEGEQWQVARDEEDLQEIDVP